MKTAWLCRAVLFLTVIPALRVNLSLGESLCANLLIRSTKDSHTEIHSAMSESSVFRTAGCQCVERIASNVCFESLNMRCNSPSSLPPTIAPYTVGRAGVSHHRYTSTGIFECVSTFRVSLPTSRALIPRRPCDAMKIRSQPFSSAALMINS